MTFFLIETMSLFPTALFIAAFAFLYLKSDFFKFSQEQLENKVIMLQVEKTVANDDISTYAYVASQNYNFNSPLIIYFVLEYLGNNELNDDHWMIRMEESDHFLPSVEKVSNLFFKKRVELSFKLQTKAQASYRTIPEFIEFKIRNDLKKILCSGQIKLRTGIVHNFFN